MWTGSKSGSEEEEKIESTHIYGIKLKIVYNLHILFIHSLFSYSFYTFRCVYNYRI